MLWAWATNKPIPRMTEDVIVRQYLTLTHKKNTGLDPMAIAAWRQKFGLADADGVHYKISFYARILTLHQMRQAAYLFGCAGACWLLPDSAEEQFIRGRIWDDLSEKPNPKKGHYTVYGGVNSAGHDLFITWGRIQAATPEYVEKYMWPGGSIAYLSQDYMTAAGTSPRAIKWADLSSDLKQLQDG